MEMEITREINNGVDVLTLSGPLDSNSAARANDEIIGKLKENGKLVLDMSGCGYVSSAGLRVILLVAKQSAVMKAKAAIAGLQSEVSDIMEMTGFASLLPKYETVEEALAALGE
ncbi:MAG: STAS domain-containing protein [Clostridiales Family XIII bacterium]|jgi:anti-anti-sigma factor|nr:STAS domain-containing protein [Clostridiales Family XIII bacterium]